MVSMWIWVMVVAMIVIMAMVMRVPVPVLVIMIMIMLVVMGMAVLVLMPVLMVVGMPVPMVMSMIVPMAVAVIMILRRAGADAFHMVVVAFLLQTDLVLEAQDLLAVFAHLAVHVAGALQDLVDPLMPETPRLAGPAGLACFCHEIASTGHPSA